VWPTPPMTVMRPQIDQGTQGSRGGEVAVVRQRFRETHRRGHRDAARSPGHFHVTLMSTQWRTRSHVFARNC
jgi:hypothetical protein